MIAMQHSQVKDNGKLTNCIATKILNQHLLSKWITKIDNLAPKEAINKSLDHFLKAQSTFTSLILFLLGAHLKKGTESLSDSDKMLLLLQVMRLHYKIQDKRQSVTQQVKKAEQPIVRSVITRSQRAKEIAAAKKARAQNREDFKKFVKARRQQMQNADNSIEIKVLQESHQKKEEAKEEETKQIEKEEEVKNFDEVENVVQENVEMKDGQNDFSVVPL